MPVILLQALEPLLSAMDQLAERFSDSERDSIQRYLRFVAGHLNAFIQAEDNSRP